MPLSSVLFLAGFVTLFGFLVLLIASKVGEIARDRVKAETYECGLPVEEKVDTKISIKFYLIAILFIIFDVEIIFLYPWAVSLKDFLAQGLGWYSLIGIGIFLIIFIFGLWWEIKSKALEWE